MRCTQCWVDFSGVANFDRHHRLIDKRTYKVECIPPQELGLILKDNGKWGGVLEGNPWEELEKN